ncbi:hypothetical protein Anas_13198, partial [Armadillidium nasatum]
VENEYGHFGYEDEPRDKKYLKFVHETLISSGFDDVLYYTSDSPTGTYDWGSLMMKLEYQLSQPRFYIKSWTDLKSKINQS